MKSEKIKKIMNLRSIVLLLSIIIFININMSTASATTIKIAPGLQNYDIQTLINGSNQGDTIKFMGTSYSNISIIIDKKLNIISTKNTAIISNNSNSISGLGTFSFYFTNKSLGSVISGFNIIAKSDYGIIVKNVKNISINFNNISGSHQDDIYLKNVSNINLNKNILSNSCRNGLNIENSKNISANKNQIKNNNYSGISISNSSNIKITSNIVIDNNLNGLSVSSSKNVSVYNNSILNNGHGIYLSNTNKVNISYNEINKNKLNGFTLEDKTENTYISNNNIIGNLNGIYIDSFSVNDTIISNNIQESAKSVYTYIDVSDTGDGIGLGQNYQESNNLITIKYNVIMNNQNFAVKSNPQYSKFIIGANWYGSNDPEETGVCPMVCTAMLKAKLLQTANGVVRFYDGNNIVKTIPAVNITFKLNGINSKTVQTINGEAFPNYNVKSSIKNVITAVVGKTILSLSLIAHSDNSNGKPQEGTPTNNKTNDTSNNNANSGNSTDNGTTNSTSGNLQGLSNIGVIGSSFSHDGSYGESKSDGQRSVEVSVKNVINKIKNNSYTLLAIFALLALIGVGYFKRGKFD
jgi:parallel beta-helix repeat protein